MKLFEYFKQPKADNSAMIAKERLQIIVAHERIRTDSFQFLPKLQEEILIVVKKYIEVSEEDVSILLDTNDSYSVLALNVTLPSDAA